MIFSKQFFCQEQRDWPIITEVHDMRDFSNNGNGFLVSDFFKRRKFLCSKVDLYPLAMSNKKKPYLISLLGFSKLKKEGGLGFETICINLCFSWLSTVVKKKTIFLLFFFVSFLHFFEIIRPFVLFHTLLHYLQCFAVFLLFRDTV